LLALYGAPKTTSLNVHREAQMIYEGSSSLPCLIQDSARSFYHRRMQQQGRIHSESITKWSSG